MGDVISTDIYWSEPGWYVLHETNAGDGKKRQEYRFFAALDMPTEDVRTKMKAMEKPPYYLAPTVRRWRKRPAENAKITVHEVE
ncbi:MAG: hypothetical protein JW966_07545 [Anaerolineae bacterium]|nr:hypothetical protein [Anaerolineae bacterium]